MDKVDKMPQKGNLLYRTGATGVALIFSVVLTIQLAPWLSLQLL